VRYIRYNLGPGTALYEAFKDLPIFEKWLYKRLETATGPTNRLSAGLLIRVEDGVIVDVEKDKPATHRIIGFHRNIHDVDIEILDLLTKEKLIFPGKLKEPEKVSFKNFVKSFLKFASYGRRP
jgi:hypothetical protein